ncbi:MAG: PEGA domain-containing protein [Myxococcota bacterium]
MLSALLLAVLAADPNPGLAVMDFAVEGAAPEIGAATSGLVAHELERLQLFRVSSAETTRVILGVERQRTLLGCENCSGANLGELTSFEFLVTGKLIRTGPAKEPKYTLLMTLMKVGNASPLSSVRAEAKGEEKLLQEVPAASLKLVGKLLEGRQGALVVASSEVGAAVKVDDTQVGTTPLQARVPVAAGPHLLTVEKEGFTAVKKEVRVNADQVSDEFVRLVPSPDMAEAYEARATRTRALAWTAAGIGVAGLAAFVTGTVLADSTFGDPTSPGTFAYHKTFLAQGIEADAGCESNVTSPPACDHRNSATALKAKIETFQTISWIGLAAAGAGAIGATVLFVVGDPPGRYEAYRQKTGVVAMQLSPAPGGVVLSGSF